VKRVVSNPQGREMILRFAAETEMDTSYAAWRLRTPLPFSIVAVTKVRTAEMPLSAWGQFLESHPDRKARFEYEDMRLMAEVMAHTITLHLLDAPGRLARFQRKHPELAGRIPKKELAAYLNLTPETLSRLKQKRA
jgi:CRP-like cAMP-binding protein